MAIETPQPHLGTCRDGASQLRPLQQSRELPLLSVRELPLAHGRVKDDACAWKMHNHVPSPDIALMDGSPGLDRLDELVVLTDSEEHGRISAAYPTWRSADEIHCDAPTHW